MLKSALGYLFYCFLRLLGWSYRVDCRGSSKVTPPAENPHCLLAIWHQNLLAGILAQAGNNFVVMVSRSSDGDPIGDLCKRLGFSVFRGSSKKGDRDKGGAVAKDGMIELLKAGQPGSLTVDGPRGPAKIVKPGIIDLARKSGLPIVPYYPHQSSYWTFNKSWDKFRFPKPFSRVDIHYGEAIYVPADAQDEEFADYQVRVADAINALEKACTPS
jgi:lysophospholipid acyltransferase (LPLAT)-like uncharacterized protein